MSDVKNLWMLRPELDIQPMKDSVGYVTHFAFNAPVMGTCATLNAHIFDNIFEPLDVESLTTQLETLLCDVFIETGVLDDGSESYRKDLFDVQEDFRPYMKSKVAEVLELIGITTKTGD